MLAALCLTAFEQNSIAQGQGSKESKVTFSKVDPNQRIDVKVDGKLFTSYWWPDSVYKPVLYPVLTSKDRIELHYYCRKNAGFEIPDHYQFRYVSV